MTASTGGRLKRASYREAVAWIAFNDEPSDRNPETVAEIISVVLIAELFGTTAERVAGDVIRFRDKDDI